MSAQKVNKNLLLHLLTENELTSREIAKRVGCSAERVRQLSLRILGRTGFQLRRERRELKLREDFEKNEFVRAAKRHGLKVEPSKRTQLDWYKREFYVNGKFCLLRRADNNVGYKGWYTAIRKPWQRAEICVLELGKGRFLIIPMKEMPRSKTMFSVDDTHTKRAYESRRYWRKYLNNWKAFNQKKGKAAVRIRRS
jgi:hypothetical protein